MSYPLQAGAPQLTANGIQFGIGAFVQPNPFGGNLYIVGVFQNAGADGWQVYGQGIRLQIDDGSPTTLLSVIKSCNGMAGFMQNIVGQMNAVLAGVAPPAPGEPTDEASAKAAVTAAVNALHFVLVNGVPTLQIPG